MIALRSASFLTRLTVPGVPEMEAATTDSLSSSAASSAASPLLGLHDSEPQLHITELRRRTSRNPPLC